MPDPSPGLDAIFCEAIELRSADSKFYGDSLLVEFPAGSGQSMNLEQVADHLTARVISLFKKDSTGSRPSHGKYNWFYQRPGNEHLLLFYEYFHGDTSHGLGASHQTGWTALVAELISELDGKNAPANTGKAAAQIGK